MAQAMHREIVGNANTREVMVGGKVLDPAHSLKLRNHSPTGFAWGYGGSGPAQLALALLLEFTNEDEAQDLYQDFKAERIALIPQDENFVMHDAEIFRWLEEKRKHARSY